MRIGKVIFYIKKLRRVDGTKKQTLFVLNPVTSMLRIAESSVLHYTIK